MGALDPLTDNTQHNLILFDGVCNLCNASVRFIINRDKKEKFKFASLQSAAAQPYINRFAISGHDLYSIVLIMDNKLYDRSSAALEIAKNLSGLWPAFYIFKIIPKFLRDAVYNLIAKNRYFLFGKKDECMIPTPELKARFLEP